MSLILPDGQMAQAPQPSGSQPVPELRQAGGVRPRTVVMILGVTLGVFAVLALGYLAWRALTWVFIAAFLAMALNPAVRFFESRGIGRGKSASIVFVLAALVCAGLGFLLFPPLVRESANFVQELPDLIAQMDRGRGPLGFLERKFNVVDRVREAVENGGAGGVLGIATPVVSVIETVVSTVFSVIAIAFLTFFMLFDGPRWVNAFLEFVPNQQRPRWTRVFDGIYRTVGGYVTGNLLISFAAGLAAGLLLLAIGVPYALPLGVLVAILDLIPLVGATIATVIIGAVALTQGLIPCLIVVGVMIAYQQLENHVLQPLVYGRSVQLSPLAVLIAVLVGAELAGVLGALAAIPVGGSIAVVAGELMRWRRETMIETPPGAALGPGPEVAAADDD